MAPALCAARIVSAPAGAWNYACAASGASLLSANRPSRPEAVVEAFVRPKHPLKMGLVAQRIGSTDRDGIEAFIQRAWTVGHNILGGGLENHTHNTLVSPMNRQKWAHASRTRAL
jgi:hypothetical protein